MHLLLKVGHVVVALRRCILASAIDYILPTVVAIHLRLLSTAWHGTRATTRCGSLLAIRVPAWILAIARLATGATRVPCIAAATMILRLIVHHVVAGAAWTATLIAATVHLAATSAWVPIS